MSDAAELPDWVSEEPLPPEPFDTFKPLIFLAWIDGDVKFDKKGDIKFNLTIPFQYRDSAMGIWNANAMPLKVRVERWDGSDGN